MAHVTGGTRRRRRRFGGFGRRMPLGSPRVLLLLLASFALCGYAGVRLLRGEWVAILIWFAGAALLHDLVLVPLYTLGDRALQAAARRRGRPLARTGVPYVRVPVFLSLLMLLVYWPLVLRAPGPYQEATGLDPDVFLGRWLLISAVICALSALCALAAAVRKPELRERVRESRMGRRKGGRSAP
ncbi:hypothetical protein [Streptomyces corynorhini]|uniref:hypothetical protein n=1 Tax=Streptomyces corynorhini TaxID=2282652 RepID=UPI0026858456